MAKNRLFSGMGEERRTPRATSRLLLGHGSTWYLRGRHLHSLALPDTKWVARGLILCRYRRYIVVWAVFDQRLDNFQREANSYAVGFAVRWKSTFQYNCMSFCPENVGNWSSSPQNDLELSPRSIQSCFQFLQRPSCKKSPSALFRSNWVKYDYNLRSDRINFFFDPIGDCSPFGSKKCWRWFLQLGPWRRGEQLWIDLGENYKPFWGEEDQFQTFSGQKLMPTYWKVPFQRTANPTA